MEKKIMLGIIAGLLFASVFAMAVSAVQLRPMNTMNHPGLTNPYQPPEDGPNHMGVSDYMNKWLGISELCEMDMELRPANQGLNIIKFFVCGSG